MLDLHSVPTGIEWENKYRPGVYDLFESEVFGRAPEPHKYSTTFRIVENRAYLSGKADYKKVQVTVRGELGDYSFPLVVISPAGKKASPAFLHISNRFPSDDSPYEPKGDFCPVEQIIERGYAACFYYTVDVSPDCDGALDDGICSVFNRTNNPDEWNTIAAWAFAASRCLDYLAHDADVDSQRVAVIGHSRAGKTALWAGASDTRFKMVVSNESGCTGAAYERGKQGERTARINEVFPYWFCSNYKKYNDREDDMPFDFHMLLALSAPRALCVSSASKDLWADPYAEHKSCYLASPIWELYGLTTGIKTLDMPSVNTHIKDGMISYHMREGDHDLTAFDWGLFLDFADEKL